MKPASRRWTSNEKTELGRLLDAGKEASEIAVALNRTRQAIYVRLQRLYRREGSQGQVDTRVEGEVKMTTRLPKFIETGSYGEGPRRAAYVLDVSALPRPAKGKEWQRIDSFSAAEEVLHDPSLKFSLQDGDR